ncbi:MAG: type II secretion system F family protein [Acidimicrobiales bacterium]|nr:type II secretion system F family protein [Acidimicrobiales bacterium]
MSRVRRARPLGPVTAPVPAAEQASALRVGRWRQRRAADPDVALQLELFARELRGGASMASATVALAEAGDPGLLGVRRRLDAGASLRDELDRWASAFPAEEALLVRAVLGLGASTGAALADALDRTAEVIRERRELASELNALTAQSRASALLVAAAPVAFLAVFGLTDPGSLGVLVTSPLGWVCLLAGIGLDGIGFWWMRRLVGTVT